ncbi:MAG: hypothetical protein B7Z80_14165 [Rhodospirillales bacterium 20-64-7]|nr:MAG: hypothetical protein B7Z80_14165 [Rhodospirillales bacterium 20-64-7]HQT75786.1 hypothetical protein [Rhodopila sp.]
MVGPFGHEDFAPYVGRAVHLGQQRPALRLARIEVSGASAVPGAARPAFILIFDGPTGDIVPEGLHRTTFEGGPTADIYIMPIHTTAPGRQEYQAVFN